MTIQMSLYKDIVDFTIIGLLMVRTIAFSRSRNYIIRGMVTKLRHHTIRIG